RRAGADRAARPGAGPPDPTEQPRGDARPPLRPRPSAPFTRSGGPSPPPTRADREGPPVTRARSRGNRARGARAARTADADRAAQMPGVAAAPARPPRPPRDPGPRLGPRLDAPGLDRRRLLRLFRPYRWRLGSVLALILISAALGMVSPFLLRAVLDQ